MLRAWLPVTAMLSACGASQAYQVDDWPVDLAVASGSTLGIHADQSLSDLQIETGPDCVELAIDRTDPTRGTLTFTAKEEVWCEASTVDQRMDGDGRSFHVMPAAHLAIEILGDPDHPNPWDVDYYGHAWSDGLAAVHVVAFRGARLAIRAQYWTHGQLSGYGLETWELAGAELAAEVTPQRRVDLAVVDETAASVRVLAPDLSDATVDIDVVSPDAVARMGLDTAQFGTSQPTIQVYPTSDAFRFSPQTATGDHILGAVDYAVADPATGEVLADGTGWSVGAKPIRDHLLRGGSANLRVTAAGLVETVRFELMAP